MSRIRLGGGRRTPSRPGSGGHACLCRAERLQRKVSSTILAWSAFKLHAALRRGPAISLPAPHPSWLELPTRRSLKRSLTGAAAVIGGMESYGHKRQHSSGGRGGPPHKRGRGTFDGKDGQVLPPPNQRMGGRGRGGRGGHSVDALAAADYSD